MCAGPAYHVASGDAFFTGILVVTLAIALGLRHEQAHGSIRMTLGKDNTDTDVARVLDVLPGIVKRLRDMSPLYADKS